MRVYNIHYAAHLLKEVMTNDFSQSVYRHEPQVLGRVEIAPENLTAVKGRILMVTTETPAKTYFRDLGAAAAALR